MMVLVRPPPVRILSIQATHIPVFADLAYLLAGAGTVGVEATCIGSENETRKKEYCSLRAFRAFHITPASVRTRCVLF